MAAPKTEELGAKSERLTFRTYRAYVEKLRVVARAHDLRLGDDLSLGAAVNMIIGKYDDTSERAKVRPKKKGARR